MDSPCIKQTVCKVLKIFQHWLYLVEYVIKELTFRISQVQTHKLLRRVIKYRQMKTCIMWYFFFIFRTARWHKQY